MKSIAIKVLAFLITIFSLSSCLEGDIANIPPDSSGSILEMMYVEGGDGTTINSGLQYFSGGALTYPASHTADTATFVVSIQGASTLDKDVTVHLKVITDALNDNLPNDGIHYELMPDSLYHFLSESAVIKAGDRGAAFQVVFYPSKFDATKNYNLPVSAENDANVLMSGNFGKIYFHSIGNPLAGSYHWDWTRFDGLDSTGTWSAYSFTDDEVVFAPVDPTTLSVPAGYVYPDVNYQITFTNNDGVLSNFKVDFDADTKSFFSAQATPITIKTAPTIVVNESQTEFVITSVVASGDNPRYLIDKYYK